MHQFFVQARNRAIKPHSGNQQQNQAAETLSAQVQAGTIQRYRVFGMTARMIVDAARVAYDQEPEFEHNSHFGDEALIGNLRRMGRLSAIRKASDELDRATMEKAAKLS